MKFSAVILAALPALTLASPVAREDSRIDCAKSFDFVNPTCQDILNTCVEQIDVADPYANRFCVIATACAGVFNTFHHLKCSHGLNVADPDKVPVLKEEVFLDAVDPSLLLKFTFRDFERMILETSKVPPVDATFIRTNFDEIVPPTYLGFSKWLRKF